MADILTLSSAEKDPSKIANVARQLAERFPASEALAAGALQKANNLSDVANVATARNNLGAVNKAGDTMTGNLTISAGGITTTGGIGIFQGGVTGNSGMATATGSLGEVWAQGNGTGAAMMTFHRPGVFAAYLGIDTDNVWKIGGWSMGANAYALWHAGNLGQFGSGNAGYVPASGGGTTNFLRADGSWAAPASGGLTLITSASFPGAATWSFTNLGGYKAFWVSIRGIQQSSGTSRTLQCALSGNNGSSYGSVRQPIGPTALATATPTNANFLVSRVDQTNNQMLWMGSFISSGNQIESGSLGPIDAIQFSWSGAATNFTAGDIDIYGLK